MEIKEFHESQFYVDDLTRELSQKYDIKSYKGPFNTLGDGNTELAMSRFMTLAKLCGEFVGVDIVTYQKRFPDEPWYDSTEPRYRERDLEGWGKKAEEIISAPALRIEDVSGKKVYFPTGDLVKIMLKGVDYIPPPPKKLKDLLTSFRILFMLYHLRTK